MAIIEELGLEVEILIGGKAVKEYPDPEPDLQGLELGPNTKTSHCYIECQENMDFVIQSKVRDGNKPAALWVKKKKQTVIFGPSFNGGPYLQEAVVYVPGDKFADAGIIDFKEGTIQKFRFSSVSTVEVTDELGIAKDMQIAKDLGLLRVGVWRGRGREEHREISWEKEDTSVLNEDCLTLAEVALKGKAISLGATISSPVMTSHRNDGTVSQRFDPSNRPFAVFEFKYRTREDLQKALIIPRPRMPSPELGNTEERQDPAISSPSRAHPNEVVADRVRDLSYEEALRLAKERLELLTLEEVFKLFGQEFKEIPLGNVLRLAGEKLTKLPFRAVLQLAGERLEDVHNHEKRSVVFKSESQEAPFPQRSSETPARIKRRREEELRSERASKQRQFRRGKDAINLTEDD